VSRPRVEAARARAKAAALALPHRPRFDVGRLLPSYASLLIGLALAAGAVAAYGVARTTPLFAIHELDVRGGTPEIRMHVRAALSPLEGRSLVGLQAADLDRRIATLPDVVGVTHDRAFPHTLRVYVRAERPLLVLRRGGESWLVSARARVVRPLTKGARPGLPRFWIPRSVDVSVGDTLDDAAAVRAVEVLSLVGTTLPARVRGVRIDGAETILILRSRVEVRLGRRHDLALKLAVAGEVLRHVADGTTYVDVAVPDRPVADDPDSEAQAQLQSYSP
jgi:cell division septal protein FtsQ